MLLSKCAEAAGFPDRWQERDLQQYISDRLTERGFQVQLQVQANLNHTQNFIVTTGHQYYRLMLTSPRHKWTGILNCCYTGG